ncbi:PREDICTED: transmembrane and TPR repeat-containing protein 2 [Gekko japonicus]|uniref:dolichyl-phosphate-mannose--protein mannosyltransferase n=1 Tax=Gekko japonicus TaxID=146911 RepID=A0ABM1JLE7_GEKJA|nr:PREDICTED: transmembrane and TPR repeat-containing protein 2 [Gekko japonicus]
MVPEWEAVSPHNEHTRFTQGGPFHDSGQCPTSAVLYQILPPSSGGHGCSDDSVAQRTSLRFSPSPSSTETSMKDSSSQGTRHSGGTILAEMPVVHVPLLTGGITTSSTSSSTRHADTGSCLAPQTGVVLFDRLGIERQRLTKMGYNSQVVDTIMSSRCLSTTKIYNCTWKAFVRWARRKATDPLHPELASILSFLQDGMDTGLRAATLRRQVAALASRKNLPLLLSIGLLIFWGTLLLGFRFYWMGNKPPSFSNSDNPAADSDTFLTRTLTFFYLPTKNLWLLLCPDTLSFDWSMDAVPLLKTVSDWRNLHTVAFYAGLLLLAYSGLKSSSKERESNGKNITNGKPNSNGHNFVSEMECKSLDMKSSFLSKEENGINKHLPQRPQLPSTENIVVLSLSMLIVPFIPATNLFFYVGFVIAERVLYIPSMGFCLLITVGTRALYIKTQKRFLKNLIFFATAALIFLYGLKTFVRNGDWQNEEMLYKSGIKVNPAKAWGNLGNVLKSQSKISESERAYRNALYYRSNMADMLYNLGLLLQESSRFSEALHYYKLAIGSRPTLASAYLNTGIILMNQGKAEDARRTFLKCSEIPDENLKDPHAHKSSVTSCLYNLGKLYHEQGQYEDALTVYKEAIQKMPRQFAPQSLYNMMGEAYMRLSRLPEAEHWYVESLHSKTDHIPAHLTYGKLLALTGRKNEAEKYFLKAIQLDPTKGNCYMHYGQFLLEESRLIEAAEMAKKAAELDNTEFDVVFNAAHMLRQASLNEAAEKYYKMAAELRPNYPAALMNLGAILHLNGKLLEAEANYLHALRLKPDDVITQSNLRKLWNIMEKQGLTTSKT